MRDHSGSSFWKSTLGLTIGIFFGLIWLVAARAEYYDVTGQRPNMDPRIAYYFLPGFLLVNVLVAMPIEYLFRRFHSVPATFLHTLLAGVAHATLWVWWAFPDHYAAFVVVNPIVVRFLLGSFVLRPFSSRDTPQ